MRRADAVLPRQGNQAPWTLSQDFFRDWWLLKHRPIDDGVLVFTPRVARPAAPAAPSMAPAPATPSGQAAPGAGVAAAS